MSVAIAQQLALVFMGRTLDSQWASSTANLLNGSQPSVALQTAFYNAAVAEGVFSTSDSPSALVNDIFQNIFGFGASSFEQTAWGNLITNGTITKETAAWTIFKSYLGATNVPDAYKLPAQSKLVAMNAYSAELLTDAAANLALASGGTAATLARTYVSGVTSQASAATAISGVAASVDALAVVPGQTYTLTNVSDNVTGTAGNDTISGSSVNSFSAFDTISGGAGDDTLTVVMDATAAPAGVSVSGVEIMNVNTLGAGFAINTTGYTGLTSLNYVGTDAGQVTVTAAATTAINLTAAGASNVDVVGGSGALRVATGAGSVQVGATSAANAYTSASFVGGTTIEIHDNATAAGDDGTTLTTVSLEGNTGSVDIHGGGVRTINATALVTAGVTITNVDIDVAHALTLGLNGVDDSGDGAATGGTITFSDDEATSVAVTSATVASYDVTLNAAKATAVTIASNVKTQFDNLGAIVATSVGISGSAALTVSAHTLDAEAAITSTSTGAVTFTGAILAGQAYSGGSGVDTITLSTGFTAVSSTGAGNDSVTYGGPAGTAGTIGGGDGTDTLVMTAAEAVTATGSADFAATVSGFEVLKLSAATGAAAAIDMARADGINSLSIAGATVGALTVTNAAADFTLTQRALTSFASSVALKTATGSSDNVNLAYSAADGFTSSAAFTIASVERLTITTTDADTTAQTAVIVTPITATSAATVTISGNMGVSLIGGMTQTTLTSLDASGLTASGAFGGLTFTAGALAASSVITGSAAGTNTVIFSAANTASTFVTYNGGTGNDTVTGSNGLNNVVNLGNGTNSFTATGVGNNTITGGTGIDTISSGEGKDTIIGGGGADIIAAGAGADSITLSGSTATFSQFAQTGGASGFNSATSNQISILTSTFDVIRGVVAGTAMELDAVANISVNLAATNLAGTDGVVNFARGTYDAANGIFTYGAAGADTAVTYDTGALVINQPAPFETVILVGYVSASGTDLTNGVITFA